MREKIKIDKETARDYFLGDDFDAFWASEEMQGWIEGDYILLTDEAEDYRENFWNGIFAWDPGYRFLFSDDLLKIIYP